MTDKAVWIVYRNHDGIVKEYMIVPHEKTMRFDHPWKKPGEPGDVHPPKTWVFDAEVVRSPDNVTRTFEVEKILEWKKA